MSRPPTLRVLSLGAGVQSTWTFLMSCRAELPKLDAAIMGDTKRERRKTYRHVEWLIDQGAQHGIPVIVASRGDLKEDYLAGPVRGGRARGASRGASLPIWTKSEDASEAEGLVRRMCTKEYKIEVVRREIRRLLGLKPGARVPPDVMVEQWFGITTDETRRMRLSEVRWITHRYPLVFDVPMSRAACVAALKEHYPDHPVPRSSCYFCPFHSDAEWRDLRDGDPDEWEDAVAFDRAIRNQVDLRHQAYLHRSCVPLGEADLNDPDPKQGNLWNQECLGMCGV